jgi:hypothetical protein
MTIRGLQRLLTILGGKVAVEYREIAELQLYFTGRKMLPSGAFWWRHRA